LLDPNLFAGVDVAWAYGNRLIAYEPEPEVFPLIETSSLHVYIDEEDWETHGALGQRNAVAMRSGNLIAFSGSFLSDRHETVRIAVPGNVLGGVLPGFEENSPLGKRLIDSVSRSSGHSHAEMAFGLFYQLERTLGHFIENVLARAHGKESFIDLLPEKVLRKLRTDAGKIDLARAYFVDLVQILRDLWRHFQPLFSGSSTGVEHGEVTKPLFEINTIRNRLVHPQAGHAITLEDIDQIRSALKLIQRAATAIRTASD
jgi:hypothetical protein